MYVPIPDPLVEFTPPPGSDPQGNPEAETTIDTVAHETEEAITDPYGTAWMDPDGFEVADKCESGPQVGTPLGYAPDGSPYNQVIGGHQYLIQDMWSNSASGCVQSSTTSTSALPLHTVSLRQFSSKVSGSLGVAKRVKITIGLLRSSSVVAAAQTTSRANGTWGPVQLRSRSGAPHAVGDDREGLAIEYGNGTTADLVATGDGGDPFTEAGYTGWFDLDYGYAVGQSEALLGPCGQTGVLTLRVGTFTTEPPAQLCNTETDAALIPTPVIGLGTPLTLTSEDNRAESPIEPDGALVKLTVALGEPDSVPSILNNQVPFLTTGFPQCTAFLRIQSVRCTGLVPETRYRIGGRRAKATVGGAIFVVRMHLHGGQALTLSNGAGRRLTTLHVAHLRVAIIGDQTRIASGSCQPGDFYGAQPTSPPASSVVGLGAVRQRHDLPLKRPREGALDQGHRPDRRLQRRRHPGPGAADPVHRAGPGRDALRLVLRVRAVRPARPARIGRGHRSADRADDLPGRLKARGLPQRQRRHHARRRRLWPGVGPLQGALGTARRQRRHADRDDAVH